MPHFKTPDSGQSYCEDTEEFDVYTDGRVVTNGPQPNDYCSACYAAEPYWEALSDEEFLKRWPLNE